MTKLAKTDNNAENAAQQLSYLIAAAKDGTFPNDLKSENFAVYVNLLQEQSAQCKPTKPEYIPGAKGGMFLNALTSETLEGPLSLVVLDVTKAYVEWHPNRGRFVKCWSPFEYERGFDSGELRYVEGVGVQTPQGNSVELRYTYTVFILNRPQWGLCKLSLSGGNLRAAKRWNFLLTHTILPGTALFAAVHTLVWTVKAELTSNNKGEWYTINPTFESFVAQETLQVTSELIKSVSRAKSLEAAELSTEAAAEDEDF